MNFNKAMSSLRNIWVKRFFLLSILSIGIVLRLYRWNGYSFWYDESLWLLITGDNLLNSLKSTIWIAKPPLFKFLLCLWSYLGDSEFLLRLLPSILGILSILIVYKVGKLLFDENTGLIASFLISFSPFHIYYSQDLSHYTLTLFLSLCSIYYLIWSLKEDKIYSWIMFIFFTSLSLYTHYLVIFLTIAENLFFFLSYRRYKKLIKKWLLAQFGILLLYSPWLLNMLWRQLYALSTYYYRGIAWIPKGSLAHILQALRIFNVGYNANSVIHFFASLLFFPLLLRGIFSNLKISSQKIKLLTIWIFIPMVLSILFSDIYPTFTYRNFIFTLPAYYILIASGIPRKYICILLISFVILFTTSLTNYYKNIFPYPENFYRPGVHAKKDNRGATKYIIDNFKKGDIVVHTSSSTVFPYVYYIFAFNKKEYKLDNYPFRVKGENYFLIKNVDEILEISKNHKRIWLVLSHWEPHLLTQYPSMEENKIREKLNSNFMMFDRRQFDGIEVYLYKID